MLVQFYNTETTRNCDTNGKKTIETPNGVCDVADVACIWPGTWWAWIAMATDVRLAVLYPEDLKENEAWIVTWLLVTTCFLTIIVFYAALLVINPTRQNIWKQESKQVIPNIQTEISNNKIVKFKKRTKS